MLQTLADGLHVAVHVPQVQRLGHNLHTKRLIQTKDQPNGVVHNTVYVGDRSRNRLYPRVCFDKILAHIICEATLVL